MSVLSVTVLKRQSIDLRVALAFAAIYVVWGTTFLAIRVSVLELPPLFAAGVRFFTAGGVLLCFTRLRGHAGPTAKQWLNLLLLGVLMFVAEYGPLFWAEKYVPSVIASILEATLPIFTLVIEVLILRQQPFRRSVAASTLVGFLGVGVLLLPSSHSQIALLPCVAILGGGITWSLGSVLSRSLDLPKSRPVTAGAAMLLGGAILLGLAAGFGEMTPLPHISRRGAIALLYLVIFGSLVGFTAFVWLLGRMPAARVSSHAYVNPVVAVALGCSVGGETVTLRTLLGGALVLGSVFLILRPGANRT